MPQDPPFGFSRFWTISVLNATQESTNSRNGNIANGQATNAKYTAIDNEAAPPITHPHELNLRRTESIFAMTRSLNVHARANPSMATPHAPASISSSWVVQLMGLSPSVGVGVGTVRVVQNGDRVHGGPGAGDPTVEMPGTPPQVPPGVRPNHLRCGRRHSPRTRSLHLRSWPRRPLFITRESVDYEASLFLRAAS